MATTIELKNSVTTGNSPSSLAQGETGWNITDKKVWIGNASSTPIQLIGAGASMILNSLTTSTDASISGLTVGKGAGSQSANNVIGTSAGANNTTGNGNLFAGFQAGNKNTTGSGNSFVGGVNSLGAGYNNTTGSYSTAFGSDALASNTTASYNTAVGYQAGYANTTSAGCTYVGYTAGSQTTGSNNTFLGSACGTLVTSGAKNTIIGGFTGNQGGLDIRTASNYIVLSDGDGNPRLIGDGSGSFGIGSVPTANPTLGITLNVSSASYICVGHPTGSASGNTYANFLYNGTNIGTISQAGTTGVLYNVTSDYRLKNDVTPIQNALATVEALNPVSFTWIDGRKDDGFIAHELQAVIPNCVTGEKDAVNEDGTPKYQQMDNSGVIPFLVKAIQELNAKVTALETQLGAK